MQNFEFGKLQNCDLIVDAVYQGGRSGNSGDDPLHKLIGVSNQGGFRYLGNINEPTLIVLTSSFNDPDWPDRLDQETGILTYYGDNKRPGRALHETPRNGNRLLRNIFSAIHEKPSQRHLVPPILVFGSAGTFRDVRFLGLAVPGSTELSALEDLVAIWKTTGGQRFQNYRASLTILNTDCVSRKWLNDIKSGNSLSEHCPTVWENWLKNGTYQPLKAETTIEYRNKQDQFPDDIESKRMIETIYDYFKDNPVAFEYCATVITQMMDKNFFSFDITRPTRDGGRDAIGLYRIGHGDSAISVDFALEAKCYNLNNAVGVKEISRLISRLRHRQFGVLVTTSFLHSQAYREIKEDAHPVVIISARDIVDICSRAGLNTVSDVKEWLKSNFDRQL